MNITKIFKAISLGFSILEHLEESGLVKSGKVIKITNVAGQVVTAIEDKLPNGSNKG